MDLPWQNVLLEASEFIGIVKTKISNNRITYLVKRFINNIKPFLGYIYIYIHINYKASYMFFSSCGNTC